MPDHSPIHPDGRWPDLSRLVEEDLHRLGAAVRDELIGRALARGDLDAIVEEAFATAFDGRGWPRDPYLRDGLVVCPGARHSTSRNPSAAHRCHFVTVADDVAPEAVWVWEHPDCAADRVVSSGDGKVLRTVSLMPAVENLTVTAVTSRAGSGGHARQRADVWQFRGGALEPRPFGAVDGSPVGGHR